MSTFIGDYDCKVDDKGRVLFPSSLRKQINSASPDRFVVKKDIYEDCLVLYLTEEWDRQTQIICKNTNPYNRNHNQFIREFFRETAEVTLDSNGRLLLPRKLLELVSISKEVVLAGMNGKIEIWAKDKYESGQMDSEAFANLAEEILGSTTLNDE